MAFADDIAGDYAIFDGGETITLNQIRSDVRNPVTISNAIKQPLTRRQIQALGGVALHGDEQVWSFNNTQPVTLGVKADNDTITDASDQTWTILSATLATIANRWDCVCRLNQ